MRRRKIKWNPDDEPLKTACVRVPASVHARLRRAADLDQKPFSAWCREALLLVACCAEDQARYLEILKNDRDQKEAPQCDCDAEQIEIYEAGDRGEGTGVREERIEIRLREDGGSEDGRAALEFGG